IGAQYSSLEKEAGKSMSEDTPIQDSGTSDTVTTAAAKTEQPSTMSLFIESLTKIIGEDEAKAVCRATEDGLFVEEQYSTTVIQAYQAWHKEITGSATEKSTRKCKKRLFGSDHPELRYIIEGKQSKVGFLLSCDITNPHKLGIPLYRGKSIVATNLLHPTDPIVAKLRNVKVTVKSSGVKIFVEARRNTFTMTSQMLQEIAEIIYPPRKSRGDVVEASCALRDILQRVSGLLPKAQFVRGRDYLLVPTEEVDRNQKLFRLGTLVFVTDADLEIKRCYGLSGRSLNAFVRQQLEILGNSKRGKGIRDFRFDLRKRGVFGEVVKGPNSYPVSYRAMMEFLELLPQLRPRLKGFPWQHTVRDLLVALVEVIQAADEVSHSFRRDKNRKQPAPRWKVGNALIFVDDHSVISECTLKFQPRPQKFRSKQPNNRATKRRR
ncbi:hypothetical protein OAO01_09740, partial [Oligoflexia bacterium]|nr:hypothetical protein [Oligoflexia bacterium]